MKNKLTAIILTLNEQEFLPGCLRSIQWADEVLVIDAGSKDKTIEIARELGARVIEAKWRGFSQQRNLAASKAKGDWILYVDSDERVSRKLRREVEELLSREKSDFQSFKIPHRNYILGRWLRHGGWYPEYQHRLIKKSALLGWEGELHEHPRVKGEAGNLKGDLIHLTHRGMRWMLEKTIKYAQLEAQLRLNAGHPKVKVRHLFTAAFREFWFRAVKTRGWRDGAVGWIEIFYQAFNQFLIMAWLWEKQKEKSMEEIYRGLDKEITNEL